MKWLKRILLLAAFLLAGSILFSVFSYYVTTLRPDLYRPLQVDAAVLERLAKRAEDKLTAPVTMANAAWAVESAGGNIDRSGRTPSAADAASPVTVELTEDELNAFVRKWTQPHRSAFEPYVGRPHIALSPGRLVVMGEIPRLGNKVAAVHFEPRLDEEGRLWMPMVSRRLGRFPLPEGLFFDEQLEQLITHLQSRIPEWQVRAKMDAGGAVNDEAVAVVAARLLTASLRHESVMPVLFSPVVGAGGKWVPVWVTRIEVHEGVLRTTVRPLSRKERIDLMGSICGEASANAAPR